MKITIVNLKAPELCAEFPSLTPELLGSVGGRYSRSADGLDAILEKIRGMDEQSAIESVLRYVDYGHQSLADMVPVAMFIDGIAMMAAYTLLNRCQIAGAQESSTRYLRFDDTKVLRNSDTEALPDYEQITRDRFSRYNYACTFWEAYAQKHPQVLQAPAGASPAVVKRFRRNWVFDRARYFLPVTCLTNVVLVQSAREWAKVARYMASHFLVEYREIGKVIYEKLCLAAPNIASHGTYCEEWAEFILAEERRLGLTRGPVKVIIDETSDTSQGWLSMRDVRWHGSYQLGHRKNRYGPIGIDIAAHPVEFGVSQIAFAEIRDLNRHRTGVRYMETVPRGFYSALDQCSAETEGYVSLRQASFDEGTLATMVRRGTIQARYLLPSLGFTYEWYHTTTLGNVIYEGELRTGTGAHYRYAKHLREIIQALYTRGIHEGSIHEGAAEPE